MWGSSPRGSEKKGLEVSVNPQLQNLVVGTVVGHHSQYSTHIGVLKISVEVCGVGKSRVATIIISRKLKGKDAINVKPNQLTPRRTSYNVQIHKHCLSALT